MTQWGMLLLCVYIALGVSGRASWRQAGRLALVATIVVIGVVMVSYSSRTPTDKYIRSVDATVYATGNQYPGVSTTATGPGLPASSTEDTAGVTAATYNTTDHSAAANTPGGSGDGS